MGAAGDAAQAGAAPEVGGDGNQLRTDLMEQTLNSYLAALEALFCNPNDEAARAWWTSEGYAPPAHPVVPLATIHKVRLQWLAAKDDMLAESRAFQFDRGYKGLNIRAHTSRKRDAERAKRGLPPLKADRLTRRWRRRPRRRERAPQLGPIATSETARRKLTTFCRRGADPGVGEGLRKFGLSRADRRNDPVPQSPRPCTHSHARRRRS